MRRTLEEDTLQAGLAPSNPSSMLLKSPVSLTERDALWLTCWIGLAAPSCVARHVLILEVQSVQGRIMSKVSVSPQLHRVL